MSEATQTLESAINSFSVDTFNRFFREKSRQFVVHEENYSRYNDDDFINGSKIGEINFSDVDKLIVCAFEVKKELSERAGKKAQYQKAKDILKSAENQKFSAGIFIFYDQKRNFRFSLVYPESIGTRRQWNNFRRFTYFVKREFTNKTFKQRIGDGDFSSMEQIKDAFSVEKVTKEFYEDIANWYFWAVEHCQFPKDAAEEENGKNIAVIRLITRMIFIWFMRERGLVPKDLFEDKTTGERLKDLSQNETTYYKAILQNLFFATLSTKKEEREFRSEVRGRGGYNPDFGNQSVFRYHQLFKNPEKLKDYFGDVPFLNGGLFECLDDGRNNNYYVDGFTERKEYQPTVPNFLFFGGEQKADLNAAYGTKNKTYKVKGLLNILSSFNFTIDENSPDDQDIALDPELLGRVFENLLASFNPETSTTARKATGSYYTPREIVDYMVVESLKAYFKTHLEDIENIDQKLENLFSTESQENPFDNQESKKLVELIESAKIVDPAVGSGAFPMGALNKLVSILNKVDPGNELWKQAQLKAIDAISDQNLKAKTKKEIEDYFQTKKPDYWRKLYLIQRCIYGVDIQQIAVEIAKLRFFISLLVDEDKNDIQPLPNLDFKIMQGNSLLEEYQGIKLFDERFIFNDGADKQNEIEKTKEKQLVLQREYLKLHNAGQLNPVKQTELVSELKKLEKRLKELEKEKTRIGEPAGLFDSQSDAKQKREKLKRLHEEFFEASEKADKKRIKDQIGIMEWEFIEATLKENGKAAELKNLEKFKKSKTKPFFLWQLNFPEVFEKGGFDIVIANPPYIGEKGHKEIFREVKHGNLGKFYQGKMDLFYFFFHLALNLGNNNSQVAFITTNYYLTASGGHKLREDFKNRAIILKLVNFNELKIFEAALGQHNMITILNKGKSGDSIAETCITKRTGVATPAILERVVSRQDDESKYFKVAQKDLYDGENYDIRISGTSKENHDPIQTILSKIKSQAELLGTISNVNQGIVTGADKVSKKHIEKYGIKANVGDGIFVLTKDEVKNLNLNKNEIKILKPWFKNSDIGQYFSKNIADEFLLDLNYTSRPDIDSYPNIKRHLLKFKKMLEDRPTPGTLMSAFSKGMWWVLTTSRRQDFNGPTILAPQRSPRNTFGYNEVSWYAASDVFFITEKDKPILLKYILALVNSKLFYLWLYHRGKRKGETLELIAGPLSEIPIKKISKVEQQPFVELVDKILTITSRPGYDPKNPPKEQEKLESEVDNLVYKLYDLTSEEVKIIENSKSQP